MKIPLRLALTLISAISAFYFVFWSNAALLMRFHSPSWLSFAAALAVAGAVGRFAWRRTVSLEADLVSSIGLGAVILGALGFAGGFFGPIIFAPGANQGPLLGIFITGPLGFILGGIGGAIYWFVRGRDRV